ncbi:MAG: aspartate--tRNA ligase [Muribaculaceae bacterium]|nr:aspartate--tRNA ligase [Muribaculaceae bacterium]
MYRDKTCGELRIDDKGKTVTLAGWVQKNRKMGGMNFLDLRDRYGITQVVFNSSENPDLFHLANSLGREFVVEITGKVAERENKNPNLPTGDIEIIADSLKVLNKSEIPPFTIEDNTDGGDDLRMKFRYLDLRRPMVKKNLELRHKMAFEIRRYLDANGFLEIETPILVKSTPEGARDFVVPSRMNPGEFYALPQSPQLFKQLLMVSGFDRYFQVAKCFRDEDLRADRQPEFTQIDCEMSFVRQEDVIDMFEGLVKHIFKYVKGIDFDAPFPRMTWKEAMEKYGSDKPDIRFGMEFKDITPLAKGKGFSVIDDAEITVGITVPGCASYSRKQIDELTEFVKRPQIGAKGLIWVKLENDGSIKSSVGKFYSDDQLKEWAHKMEAKPGDLMLIMTGEAMKTRKQLSELRLEMGSRLGLRDKNVFAPLWVIDFPLFEWDEETQRYYAMHHPFTSPNPDDISKLHTDTGNVRATAYDIVVNGNELGGGSIRIHDPELQNTMFELLGFTPEKAKEQFGFLMEAFKYGAPPHGGLALGFDRFVSILAGLDSIRDTIAFPKNNSGRDVMNESPSPLDPAQLDELQLQLKEKNS